MDEVNSSVDGNVSISICRMDSNTQYFVEYDTAMSTVSCAAILCTVAGAVALKKKKER